MEKPAGRVAPQIYEGRKAAASAREAAENEGR